MAAEIIVRNTEGYRCDSQLAGLSHIISTDAPKESGGQGELMSPTDLIAASLGSCIATTVAIVAKRHSIDTGRIAAKVVKEMVSEPRRMIGSLEVKVSVEKWDKLPDDVKLRLERAAAACPVKASLNHDIKLSCSIASSF